MDVLGLVHLIRGELDAAFRAFRQAPDIDPRSVVTADFAFVTAVYTRQWEEADRYLERIRGLPLAAERRLDIQVMNPIWLAVERTGDVGRARAVLAQSRDSLGLSPAEIATVLSDLPALVGDSAFAEVLSTVGPEAARQELEAAWALDASPRSRMAMRQRRLRLRASLGDVEACCRTWNGCFPGLRRSAPTGRGPIRIWSPTATTRAFEPSWSSTRVEPAPGSRGRVRAPRFSPRCCKRNRRTPGRRRGTLARAYSLLLSHIHFEGDLTMASPFRAPVRSFLYIFAAAAATLGAFASASTAQEAAPARAVLVTGATSGIGLRITEVLSRNGFFVYAGARAPEDMERLNAMPNVRAVRLDVTIPSEIDSAVAVIEREGRGLYGLINNAGIATMEPLIEIPEEVMAYQLDVNLLGPYRVTRGFADLLIESGGRILNVSSIAGIVTGPFSGAYSMSKHGVEAYTDGLAAELAQFGVTVAAVEPGNYRSQIVASMVKRMQDRGYSAEGSRYGSMLDLVTGPLDRSQYQEPDDVALAALEFLTTDSPKRRYMVVPNRGEAEITIRGALQELAQLNEGQPYAYSRDELVRMLDDALGRNAPAPSGPGAHQAPAQDLMEAVVQGDVQAVRRLIEAGADVDAREPTAGSTPLIAAATFGRTAVAVALIEAGADVDVQNNDGSTALMTAALLARTEIVRALLDAGADPSIRNNVGASALDIATAPFESLRSVYDFLSATLGPYGLELDYDRIRETLPEIAAMLR